MREGGIDRRRPLINVHLTLPIFAEYNWYVRGRVGGGREGVSSRWLRSTSITSCYGSRIEALAIVCSGGKICSAFREAGEPRRFFFWGSTGPGTGLVRCRCEGRPEDGCMHAFQPTFIAVSPYEYELPDALPEIMSQRNCRRHASSWTADEGVASLPQRGHQLSSSPPGTTTSYRETRRGQPTSTTGHDPRLGRTPPGHAACASARLARHRETHLALRVHITDQPPCHLSSAGGRWCPDDNGIATAVSLSTMASCSHARQASRDSSLRRCRRQMSTRVEPRCS